MTGPADVSVSAVSLPLDVAAAHVVTRCSLKRLCGGDGAILRLVASIMEGACCCCRYGTPAHPGDSDGVAE